MAAAATTTAMPDIEKGFLRAYFFFDVADSIDLTKVLNQVTSISGSAPQRAQLSGATVAAPTYIKFQVPPVVTALSDVSVCGLAASARVKIFDSGTLAVRLSVPFAGSWSDYFELSLKLRKSSEPGAAATTIFNQVMKEIAPALDDPYSPVSEDYFVFNVETFKQALTANDLLTVHQGELATMLLGERRQLSQQEQEQGLKSHFTFAVDDLAVVQWDAAFVLDEPSDSEVIESIIEFANVQLVQYLTHDRRLDAELEAIYSLELLQPGKRRLGGHHKIEERAQRLRHFLADTRQLADRANNALKMIGDVYYARLYRGISMRLGLPDWQQQVDSKLESVAAIYQFVSDEAKYAQSHFIEVVIVILIAFEVVVGLFKH